MGTRTIRLFLRLISRKAHFYLLAGLGLVTAISTATFIYGYVSFENSFDKQHSRANDLHRVHFTIHKNGTLESVNANSTPVIGPLLFDQLEGVEDFARLYPRSGSTIQIRDANGRTHIYPEDKIYHADSSFLRMFGFPLLAGSAEKILLAPLMAVVSERFAIKAFGSVENALGKTFQLTEAETYLIQGVFQDVPVNTHFSFEILLSFSTLEILDWTRENIRTDWGWYSHYNYVLLNGERDIDVLNEEILSITKPHTKATDERINGGLTYTLFPLKDVYLDSDVRGEMERKGNGTMVRFMALTGILLIILAIVNYVGITSSMSLSRIKETGLRRILGSSRWQLLRALVLESMLHLVVTFALAIGILVVIWNYLPALTGKTIPILILWSPPFFMAAAGVIVVAATLCGSYQYFLVTKPDLVASLKGVDTPGGSTFHVRKGILFFQYTVGISLFIFTIVSFQQTALLHQTDPGFKHENTLAIKLRRTRGDSLFFKKIDAFANEVANVGGVRSTALSSHVPSEEVGWTSGGKVRGQLTTVKFHHFAIDENFIKLYGLQVVAGSDFTANKAQNSRAVIVNRQGARSLGFEHAQDALNKTFLYAGRSEYPFTIIGVVDDHFQRGLKYAIDPIAFHYLPDHRIYTGSAYNSLRLEASASLQQVQKAIEKTWRAHFPGLQIEYSDIDQKYMNHYQSDRRAFDLLKFFTLVAIMISLLGLIGTLAFTINQRTKEIGIRKVLGASIQQLLLVLSKSYLLVILFAVATSWLVSYFVVDSWLRQYPMRVAISPTSFIVAACLVAVVSAVLIIVQSLKSGINNPIDAIRTE